MYKPNGGRRFAFPPYIGTWGFSSRSEVVNDLIRKARQQHEDIELLRAKRVRAEQGEASNRTPEQIRKEAKERVDTGL